MIRPFSYLHRATQNLFFRLSWMMETSLTVDGLCGAAWDSIESLGAAATIRRALYNGLIDVNSVLSRQRGNVCSEDIQSRSPPS